MAARVLARAASGFSRKVGSGRHGHRLACIHQVEKLLARLLCQVAPQANDASIVLVQYLIFLKPRLDARQNHAVLLQDLPVARLDIRL
jgi:hypothetical protein